MKMIEDLGLIYATDNSKARRHYGIFECPYCGKHFRVSFNNLNTGRVKSCGCTRLASILKSNYKHGMCYSKIHYLWTGIKSRCLIPSASGYSKYGGRGINICSEWKDSFVVFRDWAMANGYRDGLQIDRINNNGDYEPSNCRWVTPSANQQNKGKTRRNTSGYKGVFKRMTGKWSVAIMSNKQSYFLGVFDDVVNAAKRYDSAARALHGEYAVLNFPENE